MLEADPLTAECARILPDVSDVCIGVSPFNSYFSTERLTGLAAWGFENFSNCHFFIPDELAAYTLEAVGYPAGRAKQKARRQGNYVYNKVRTALKAVSAGVDADSLILDMKTLRANDVYCELLADIQDRFESDPSFRDACLDASHWVLDRKLPEGEQPNDDQLISAVRYFLGELPLFAGSGRIVGHETSMFVYHQRVDFLEKFFNRELSMRPHDGQGFLVVNHPGEQPVQLAVTA